MQVATFGKSSLTGSPHLPDLLNFHGLASVLPTLLNCVGSTFAGNGLPWYFSRSGFGSKVSTCDGPPSMNRKMTLVALAANWGFLGVKGELSEDDRDKPGR